MHHYKGKVLGNVITLSFSIVVLLSIQVIAQEPQKSPLEKHDAKEFSISVPAKWSSVDLTPQSVSATMENLKQQNPQARSLPYDTEKLISKGCLFLAFDPTPSPNIPQYHTNLTVMKSKLGVEMKLKEFIKGVRASIEAVPKGFVPPLQQTSLKIGEYEATKLSYKVNLKAMTAFDAIQTTCQYIFMQKENAWSITCSTLDDLDSPTAALFDDIAKSFLLSTVQEAGPNIEGMWGIQWRASKEKAKSIMLSHDGVSIDEAHSDSESMLFKGGTFGGEDVSISIVLFYKDSFCKGAVYFHPKEHEVIYTFKEWLSKLTEKYGKPAKSFEFFQEPYYDGDGYETQAIRKGKGHFSAFWEFPGESGLKNSIMLRIDDDLTLGIHYENGDLTARFHDERKEQQQKEY